MTQELNFSVARLGECKVPSPMTGVRFVGEAEHILFDSDLRPIKKALAAGGEPPCFEAGEPRERIFFDPSNLACGIVTCGGLCPRLNEVECIVLVGGELRSRKGLNLPGIDLGIRAFEERDRECLKFALENGVDKPEVDQWTWPY